MSDWADDLINALQDYTKEVAEGVEEAAQECAEEAVAKLKQTSPKKIKGKKRGKYARGWRVKNTAKGAGEISVTVHNATDYQLTHLLEHGHANRDGSFTAPRVHIAPVEEEVNKKFEGKVKLVIQG